MDILETIKIYATLLKENSSGYQIRFNLSHKYNDDKLIHNNMDLINTNWITWVPKDRCIKLSEDYFLIHRRLFNNINMMNERGIDFNSVRNFFRVYNLPINEQKIYIDLVVKNLETNN